MKIILALILCIMLAAPVSASTLKEKAVSVVKRSWKMTYGGARFVCAKTYNGACVVSKKLEPLVPLASVVGSSGPILYALLVPR